MQRNGRVWIARRGMCPFSIDAAQYGMLINLKSRLSNNGPSQLILHQLTVTCLAQQQADLQHHVQWSRHLLACFKLQTSTGATLSIGASAVTYNPQFPVNQSSELCRNGHLNQRCCCWFHLHRNLVKRSCSQRQVTRPRYGLSVRNTKLNPLSVI
jgi:hypothetical protein